MNSLRIIFMGTPEFAVPSLEILVRNNINVVAVVTAPDKPSGRGQKITFSPVKEYAIRNTLLVLQPTNLKDKEFLSELKSFNADLQVVVAFRMLPEVVWNMPPLGTINLHASLLPFYRGAAPIHWAIINGEKETGVTTFFLKHEIDTGNILFQEKEPIYPTDDAGSLYDRLKIKGSKLVLKSVVAIADGKTETVAQSKDEDLKKAPKIHKETCEINWNKKSSDVYNFIRGLSPYPAAWTRLNSKTYKILKTETDSDNRPGNTGEIFTDQKTFLKIKTGDGWITILELQPEGKKRMPVSDFFRGNKL